MSLRDRPPRPRAARVAPSYPRVILATALLAASGCAIYPLNDDTPQVGGAIAAPFDSGLDTSDAPPDGGGDTLGDPQPDGFAVNPYDGGDAAPDDADASDAADDANDAADDAPSDADAVDSGPDPAGDIALPYDDAGAPVDDGAPPSDAPEDGG